MVSTVRLSFSMPLTVLICATWLVICALSIGLSGSWFFICATSSFMKRSSCSAALVSPPALAVLVELPAPPVGGMVLTVPASLAHLQRLREQLTRGVH